MYGLKPIPFTKARTLQMSIQFTEIPDVNHRFLANELSSRPERA